jgi:hypothetical protein
MKSEALRAYEVVANAVHTVKIGTKNVTYKGEREGDQRLEMPTCECGCTEIQCTVQRVQPDQGHHCGRRHSKRYDSTGLFTVTYQLIYRHCTCTVQGCWNTSASLTAD